MRIDGVINLNPSKQKNNFMRQFYKKFLIRVFTGDFTYCEEEVS